MSNNNNNNNNNTCIPINTSEKAKTAIQKIEEIITQDEGGRGVRELVVPRDLEHSANILASLKPNSHVLILSGFPCCVNEDPPTETDGPPGTVAIAKASVNALGHRVTIVVDDCNAVVFRAAIEKSGLGWLNGRGNDVLSVVSFPAESNMTRDDYDRLNALADACDLVIACERAGPSKDGHCYTMKGIDMTAKGLIAPLHKIVDRVNLRNSQEENSGKGRVYFIAIGDGGNEMGMGKVYMNIVLSNVIKNGEKIAAMTAADFLVAASVSNWGGYALAAATLCIHFTNEYTSVSKWLPTEDDEIALLQRCIDKGCRDGVSGKTELTVDGMPLQTSLECLNKIRDVVIEFVNEE